MCQTQVVRCHKGLTTGRACPSCLDIKTAKCMARNTIIQSADWFCTSVWSYKFRLISLIDSYSRTSSFLLSQCNCITKSKSSSFNSTGQNDKSTLTSGERRVVGGETNESVQHTGWGWLLQDLLHYCVLIQLRARPERGSHYRGLALWECWICTFISLSSHILQHYLGAVLRLFCADLGDSTFFKMIFYMLDITTTSQSTHHCSINIEIWQTLTKVTFWAHRHIRWIYFIYFFIFMSEHSLCTICQWCVCFCFVLKTIFQQ